MEIRSLGGTGFDRIYEAFSRAFAGYEIQQDREQLRAMLKRRGFDPALSFAAFDEDEIAAFTFNGIGVFNGIPTAYDTGTGTLEAYRGQGLATRVFEHSVPYLREMNIKQYLLEVLQHNTGAVSVYRNLGFETSREFNYFSQKNEQVILGGRVPAIPCSIREIDLETCRALTGFHDFDPSWQNSFESIQRAAGDFIALGAFCDNGTAGYCIFEPAAGDIALMAVEKQNRRKGIASMLLGEVCKRNRCDSVKVINTDIRCSSITRFLEAKNIGLKGKQFEMIKIL